MFCCCPGQPPVAKLEVHIPRSDGKDEREGGDKGRYSASGQNDYLPSLRLPLSVNEDGQIGGASMGRTDSEQSNSNQFKTLSDLNRNNENVPLGLEAASISVRHAAYLERKHKKTKSKQNLIFLSNVPEVSRDIAFRYKLCIFGDWAQTLIVNTCDSVAAKDLLELGAKDSVGNDDAAHGFPRGQSDAFEDAFSVATASAATPAVASTAASTAGLAAESAAASAGVPEGGGGSTGGCTSPTGARIRTSTSSSLGEKADKQARAKEAANYRCLSKVELPDAVRGGGMKLAKLAFVPLGLNDPVPRCTSRADALSTVVLLSLTIDPKDGEPTVNDQLFGWENLICEMRRVQRKLRPSRAILLTRRHDTVVDDARSASCDMPSWEEKLADFEEIDGPAWKFGPVHMREGNELHSFFSEISSVRIVRAKCSDDADSDGSHASSAPPLWEAERCVYEEDDEEEEDAHEGPAPSSAPPAINVAYLSLMEQGAA